MGRQLAIERHHLEVVTELLAAGVDISQPVRQDNGETTTFFKLAIANRQPRILAALLKHQPADDDNDNACLLTEAVIANDPALVCTLLEADIPYPAPATDGASPSSSPLLEVIKNDNVAILKLLLDHYDEESIDINAFVDLHPQDGGMTPLHVACRQSKTNIVHLLLTHPRTAEIIQFDAVDGLGRTALDIALQYRCFSVVALLRSR